MSHCRRHRWPRPFSGVGRLKNTRLVYGCELGACSLTACAGNDINSPAARKEDTPGAVRAGAHPAKP